MSTIGNTYPTLVDVAARSGEDGKVQTTIAELLSQTNEPLQDIPWIEGNLPTGHKTIVRTGLPQATWRRLNYGVPAGKSTTAAVTDVTGMLETYSVIDKDLADLNGNTASFRLTEDRAFLEGMNQQFTQALFYESIGANPDRITGLSPRYSSLSAGSGANIVDAGGTGSSNTSIWLVVWGPDTIHGIYPKGTIAGLTHMDVTTSAPILDVNGNRFQAYQTKYQWKCGLTVRDWRYAVRICNIDTTTSAGGLQSTTPPNLYRLMIKAMNKIPNFPANGNTSPNLAPTGKAAFYVNRAVKTWGDIQAMEKTTLAFQTIMDAQGRPFLSFRGVPVRLTDQLLNTETRVV
ncbi:major capsid protein [Labrys sp. La1]|uniref:major capsid protein n=1 Tax=Labrys sp. La1 TaxID=3404917 RepID=UPI003EBBAD0F